MNNAKLVIELWVEIGTYFVGICFMAWGAWSLVKLYLQWRSEQQRMISRGPDKRTNRAMQDWSDKC